LLGKDNGGSETLRILRGGCWFDSVDRATLKSAFRMRDHPTARDVDGHGFRCVIQLRGTALISDAEIEKRARELAAKMASKAEMRDAAFSAQSPSPDSPLPARGFYDLTEVFDGTRYDVYNAYARGHILDKAQEKLKAAGFYKSMADGRMGSGTQQAIIQWQRQHELPETGRLDAATQSSLGLLGLSEVTPLAHFAGNWSGVIKYGAMYTPDQQRNPIHLSIEMKMDEESGRFSGVVTEEYNGFGTTGPDGKMHGSVNGTVKNFGDKYQVYFSKSYDYFEQEPTSNNGTYDPDTGVISGRWSFTDGAEGTFSFQKKK